MRKFIFYFEIARNKESILQVVKVIVYANSAYEAISKATKRIVEDYPIEAIQEVKFSEMINGNTAPVVIISFKEVM